MNLSEPMPPEQMAKFWEDFINGHIPNFRKSPYDQIDNYVKDCWTAIVDTAKWAEKDLPRVLDESRAPTSSASTTSCFSRPSSASESPGCASSPARRTRSRTKRYPASSVRLRRDDKACHQPTANHFNDVIGPIHADFNAFLEANGEAPYPLGQFFEASPYHEPAALSRAGEIQAPQHPLDPERFQYLEGCVRKEKPYEVPAFAKNDDGPLIYVSFGSLGAGDIELLKRIIAALGRNALSRAGQCRRLQGPVRRRAAET